MESAMAASTGGPGTWTYPSAARLRVMLWATVNAVTVLTILPKPLVRMISARTNGVESQQDVFHAQDVALGTNEKHVHQKPSDHHQSDQHFYQHSGKCAHR